MRSITMSRVLLPGALALGALGATFGFTPGVTTAEAANSVSPFAGTYGGADPRGAYPWWKVTISNAGRIESRGPFLGQRISGNVKKNGSYSFNVRARDRELRVDYDSAGTLALDAAGNIVGTDDTGRSFSWLRQ